MPLFESLESQLDINSGQNLIEASESLTIEAKKEMIVTKLKIEAGGELQIDGRTTILQGLLKNDGLIKINGILRLI
jgi:hypothetical protein